MARPFGAQIVTTNYEVTVRKPFDARTLVTSYEDLLVKDHWLKAGTSQLVAYNGMIVSVANTSDTSKNGLYMLFDINCTTALKSPDVTVETNWLKIGETSDISEFVSRIETIENSLRELTEDLSSLDTRVTALEDEDKLHTYGYRAGFPDEGESGHMYVAVDEKKTYVWFNNEYIPVGGDSGYEEPEVIYGGAAN